MTILQKLKSKIWFWIHRNRRNRLVGRFARLCKNIHRASEHPTFNVILNGEKDVLGLVLQANPSTVFDVGANIGDWSLMAHEVAPYAVIHAFEMNPKTASILRANCAAISGIRIHDIGLSDRAGESEFFAYDGFESEVSSLRSPLFTHIQHTIATTLLSTGDSFCEEQRLERIDFLKVDAEGADYEVIKGFSKMLEKNAVKVIQFEHQGGRYLKDFYLLLEPHGYAIGKLYANYVDFRSHDIEMEHFLGPNYIAIPAGETRLIERLRAGW